MFNLRVKEDICKWEKTLTEKIMETTNHLLVEIGDVIQQVDERG